MEQDDVITQAEAARLLGVSRQRVEAMIDQKLLTPIERQVTVRYLRRSEVEALRSAERLPGRPRQAPAPPAPTATAPLTVALAADHLGVTPAHVRLLYRRGTLHGEKLSERVLLLERASVDNYARTARHPGRPARQHDAEDTAS